MNITVFGATGTIGSLLVSHALAAGHDVTAHTRNASRVTTDHPRLRVVEGDPTDPAGCLPAVTDADAVVIAIGAGRKGAVREAATRAVVEAMRRAGVRRLVCQSTIGVGSSRPNLDLYWKYVMFGALLRPAYADHVRQEQVVMESGLDWTVVRPSAFAEESPAPVRSGFDGAESGLTLKVGREDVAAFLLAQATDGSHLHRPVSLSS